jgi:hypothetical protein
MQNLTLFLTELRIEVELMLGLLFLVSISAYLRVAWSRIDRLPLASGE